MSFASSVKGVVVKWGVVTRHISTWKRFAREAKSAGSRRYKLFSESRFQHLPKKFSMFAHSIRHKRCWKFSAALDYCLAKWRLHLDVVKGIGRSLDVANVLLERESDYTLELCSQAITNMLALPWMTHIGSSRLFVQVLLIDHDPVNILFRYKSLWTCFFCFNENALNTHREKLVSSSKRIFSLRQFYFILNFV